MNFSIKKEYTLIIMLSSTNKAQVLELFNTIGKDDEFEVMFNNYRSDNVLPLNDFMNVMKYVKYKSDTDQLKLYETIILDIIYNTYRISINGIDNINNFLGLVYQKKNNNMFILRMVLFLLVLLVCSL